MRYQVVILKNEADRMVAVGVPVAVLEILGRLALSIYSTSYEKFTVLDKAVVICYTCNGYKCNISL